MARNLLVNFEEIARLSEIVAKAKEVQLIIRWQTQ